MTDELDVDITGIQCKRGAATIGFEGGACQLLAGAFAEQFAKSEAINYLEMSFEHEEHGAFVVTLQKAGGMTPGRRVEIMKELIRAGKMDEALAL